MTDTTPVLLGEGRLMSIPDTIVVVIDPEHVPAFQARDWTTPTPARNRRREYTRRLARIAAAGTMLAAVFAAFAAYCAGWPIPHTVAAAVLAVGVPAAGYAGLIASRYHRGYVIANGRMRVAPKPEER